MNLRRLVVLLGLLLSACSGGFDVGDKVIVVTDYGEVRIGYMVGKFVSSKGDNVNVEIRKFKDMNAPDDLEKGDEEAYPSNQVYSYEEGRAVVGARKKFFKETNRLAEGIMQTSQISDMAKSILQSMISGGQNNAMPLMKDFMKQMHKRAKKLKIHEDKIDSLQALAKAGKLKEWEKAIPLLQALLEAQANDANSLDDIYSEMHASMDKMDKDVEKLTDVFKAMPYIDDATGSSLMARFVGAVYGATYAAYQGKVMDWIKTNKNKLKKPDIKTIRRFLDLQKENLAIGLHMALPALTLNNIYRDGDFDDQIESIHDKIDTLNDDHTIYDMAARSFIKQKLTDMKTFKQPQADVLKQLQNDLSALGSSEENLEIDLSDLLDQAYGAYEIVGALEKDHWQGKWEFKGYRHFNKNVRLSKVTFSPMVSNALDKVTFSGRSDLSLSDRGEKNVQKFNATFKISDDESFQFSANIRRGNGLKCGFMENQEIQCIAPRASSSLTLYTKEQRAARKARVKAEEKARKEAAKAASAVANTKGEPAAIHDPVDIIAPEATSSIVDGSSTTKNNSWGEPSSPKWQSANPKAVALAKAPVSKPASVKHANSVQVHQQIKPQHQNRTVRQQTHPATVLSASRPHANNRLSQADSRKLDMGIQTLKALL